MKLFYVYDIPTFITNFVIVCNVKLKTKINKKKKFRFGFIKKFRKTEIKIILSYYDVVTITRQHIYVGI